MRVHSEVECRALEWLDSRVVLRRMSRPSDNVTAETVVTSLALGDATRTSYGARGVTV